MWRFEYATNAFVPQGEILNMYDTKVVLQLSKLDTLSFRVRLDNQFAPDLSDCKGYIRGWHNGVLRFYGPVITAEEAADSSGANVVVNCLGGGWVLSKRLIRMYPADTYTPQPVKDLLYSMINYTNNWGSGLPSASPEAPVYNNTGIKVSLADITVTGSVTVTEQIYRPILNNIMELGRTAPGFEWRILPLDNDNTETSGGVPLTRIGKFVAAPVIGTSASAAVFEWGTISRNNVVAYKRTTSREQQANEIINVTSFGPNVSTYPVVRATDTDGSSRTVWGRLEDRIETELLDTAFRQSLAEEHVRVRKFPKQTLEFTPQIDPELSGAVPIYGPDFSVGDTITARAAFEGTTRFNVFARVWAVTFERDNNGTEKMSLTLVEEE